MNKKFRMIAYLEGISLLILLLIAMPLKYIWGIYEFVKIVGWAHGLLFIAYVGILAVVKTKYNWNSKKTALALLAAVLPFGPFVFEWYLRRERL